MCPAVLWSNEVGQTAAFILPGFDPILIVCFVSLEITKIDITHRHVQKENHILLNSIDNMRQPPLGT